MKGKKLYFGEHTSLYTQVGDCSVDLSITPFWGQKHTATKDERITHNLFRNNFRVKICIV